MRVLVVTAQLPFVRGGAEVLADGLIHHLRKAGHEAEIVGLPFKWYPPERIPDHMLACRLLDLSDFNGQPIDKVIALKFPAYLVPHPNKTLWILHQHRTAYDLWDDPACQDLAIQPNGAQVRDLIHRADRELIPQSNAVYTISQNVSNRLNRYCGVESQPLYPPLPDAEGFFASSPQDYLFYPSRLTVTKRQYLVIQALAHTRAPVRIRFAGRADAKPYQDELEAMASKLGVSDRIEWLGPIDEAEKRRQYANALGVVFPPLDEDYGYITLEAMMSSKPVITCTDSGGPLEFVVHRECGMVGEPTPQSLAAAMDELWDDRSAAQEWGRSARDRLESFNITWPRVVETLIA